MPNWILRSIYYYRPLTESAIRLTWDVEDWEHAPAPSYAVGARVRLLPVPIDSRTWGDFEVPAGTVGTIVDVSEDMDWVKDRMVVMYFVLWDGFPAPDSFDAAYGHQNGWQVPEDEVVKT